MGLCIRHVDGEPYPCADRVHLLPEVLRLRSPSRGTKGIKSAFYRKSIGLQNSIQDFASSSIWPKAQKSSVFITFTIKTELFRGGEEGIRTLDTLMGYTRFPIVRARPTTRLLRVCSNEHAIQLSAWLL